MVNKDAITKETQPRLRCETETKPVAFYYRKRMILDKDLMKGRLQNSSIDSLRNHGISSYPNEIVEKQMVDNIIYESIQE